MKGISERLAMEIAGQIEEKRELRRAMLFLSGYGIRMNLAVKIYQRYGGRGLYPAPRKPLSNRGRFERRRLSDRG